MDKIIINGGKPLMGTVEISGMKNAAVAVILSTLLIDDTCVLENIPDISDVTLSLEILRSMGAEIRRLNRNTVEINVLHEADPNLAGSQHLLHHGRHLCTSRLLGTGGFGKRHERYVQPP